MKLTLIHHLHTSAADGRPCVFDTITVKVNDRPVLIGTSPKVFHSTLEVYKWLLTRQGIEVEEINIRV